MYYILSSEYVLLPGQLARVRGNYTKMQYPYVVYYEARSIDRLHFCASVFLHYQLHSTQHSTYILHVSSHQVMRNPQSPEKYAPTCTELQTQRASRSYSAILGTYYLFTLYSTTVYSTYGSP